MVLFITLNKVVQVWSLWIKSWSVTLIQVKATKSPWNYRAVISCGAVYYAEKGGSKFRVCGENPNLKATEQYFLVALFIMLITVVKFWVCGYNPKIWPFKWKLLSSHFPVALFFVLYKVVWQLKPATGWSLWSFRWKLSSCSFLWCCLLFWKFTIVDEILKRDHWNKSYTNEEILWFKAPIFTPDLNKRKIRIAFTEIWQFRANNVIFTEHNTYVQAELWA